MTQSRFSTYAWGVVAYNVLVILWGALVRATGSGAGCGSHWPLCNGEVIPRPEETATLIEFSHRVSSSLAGLFVVILLIWAFRIFVKSHPARKAAVYSFILILVEGAIGAALVRLELVGDNASTLRVVVLAFHLGNTLLLLAALTATAYRGSGLGARESATSHLAPRTSHPPLYIGLVGLMIVGMAGAVTALGDTLFPAGTLAEGIAQDFSPTAPFLVQLRVWHPVIAIIVSIYLLILANRQLRQYAYQMTRTLEILIVVQLLAGFINVYLLAPVWMQMVHLLLADAIWIALILIVLQMTNLKTSP